MKKFFTMLLILVMTMAIFVGAQATNTVYFDVKDGQKVLYGDAESVVEYLVNLNRQQVLDLAKIDREGEFYARILPDQHVLTWDDGSNVSAFDLTENMEEYSYSELLLPC